MRWSEVITLEFVKLYLKHECLWNPLHPGYKLKYQREEAYFDLKSEFKSTTMKSLSVAEVKNKIKNLRSTYAQEVHKILQKSSPDSIYEPSLIWFNEMDRCLKHVPGHRYSTFYAQETSEVGSSHQIWVDNELELNNPEEVNPDPLIQQTENEYANVKQEDSKIKIEKYQSQLQSQYKKKRFRHKSHIGDYSKDPSLEDMNKEDEFDIYGKFIASQLRKLDLQKALTIQLEIQNIISEARLSDLHTSIMPRFSDAE